MLLLIGSIVLAALQIIVMLLIARRYRFGWLFAAIVNTIWFPYDYFTSQYGFMTLGIVVYYTCYIGWTHHNDIAK